jgi:hypothetical protein
MGRSSLSLSKKESATPQKPTVRNSAHHADSENAHALYRLQRKIGNQALRKLLNAQAKLSVNEPGDRYEQEADRVADRVMRMPDPSLQPKEEEEEPLQARPLAPTITPFVQRQSPEEEEPLQRKEEEEEPLQTKAVSPGIQREQKPGEEEPLQRSGETSRNETLDDVEASLSRSKGSGEPLGKDQRAFFEPRFGADFGSVRIHTGGEASRLNRAVSAQAFTHGNDVYFGDGKYNPGSSEGKQLLAHELTHVVQQNGSLSPSREQVKSSGGIVQVGTAGNRPFPLPAIQCLDQSLPYVGPLASYLNPINQLRRIILNGLSDPQKALLDGIFGSSLATSLIRLNPNSILAAGNCFRTTGNIINMSGTTISNSTLIHEAAHVWQSQNTFFGFGYAVSALKNMAIAQILGGDWQRAYDYRKVEKYKIPWRYWNAEQQASWIEDNKRLPSGWMLQTFLPDFGGIESTGL